MSKRVAPSFSSSSADLAGLRKEVAALRKQVAALQKSAASSQKRVRSAKAVVNGIEVVDASGKVVASIDSKGNLFCLSVWASTAKNTRGVFIDGGAFRKISAGRLELIGTSGNEPGLTADGDTGAGQLTLSDPNSDQILVLQGEGAPLQAFDANGRIAAVIDANVPEGGIVAVFGTTSGSKGAAAMSVSHLSGCGTLALQDRSGKVVTRLP